MSRLKQKLTDLSPDGKYTFSREATKIRLSILSVENKLRSLKYREPILKRQIAASQSIPEQNIKEFEIANIIRLGLARVVYEASAGTHSIDVPSVDPDSYTSVDFDIEIDTEVSTVLTELGELFIDACREKHA